ncbi:hypothetical protein HF313_04285 [Massilia atriviolacea]|uniref:Uncharacterized protein n=1 Tax=Massilia atriviolacea TaxID=2495579 RepID=A0A430HD61_9BURK|nr:hypothetical protein [Massilia atriviolacea]RSZ55476.1 hypothetical protein EJB06_29135 [Massilia atriviolacea]
MHQAPRAIFSPLISKRTAGLVVLAVAVFLACIILFLPQNADLSWIYLTPDALAMSQRSYFPSSLALAYSCAIYGGVASALLTSFAEGDLRALSMIRQKHTPGWRFLSDLFVVIFVLLLLTIEFSNYAAIVLRIDLAISTNKFFAILWVEGLFGFIYTGLIVCFFDLAELIRKKYAGKQR